MLSAWCGRSIETLDELIKPRLLLQEVSAGRSSGLYLQSQMHALVAAVLLGPTGLDALDADAQA